MISAPIRTKILLSFFVIALFSSLFLLVSYPSLKHAKVQLSLIEPKTNEISLFYEQLKDVEQLAILLQQYILISTQENLHVIKNKLQVIEARNHIILEGFSGIQDLNAIQETTTRVQESILHLVRVQEGSDTSTNINRLIVRIYSLNDALKDLYKNLVNQGLASLRSNISEQNKTIATMLDHFIMIEVLIIFISIFLAIFLSKFITSNLSKFEYLASSVARGDLSVRIPHLSSDELGDLANAFNHMIDQLVKTTVSRDTLRDEVAVRTRIETKLETMAAFPMMNPSPTLRLDDKGIITIANPASTHYFGIGDLIGKHWIEVCPEMDTEKICELYKNGGEWQQDALPPENQSVDK